MAMNFGKLDFAVSFNRQTAFPLDAKSYFESLENANAAAATAQEAGSSDSSYYYGQQVAVVENGVATLYVIQPDKTLKEVGGKVAINENVFVKDAEGKLDLLGFADAVAGAQLVKSVDGKVSWVKPDTTTVEGLSASVETLRTDVNNLQTAQTAAESKISALETTIGAPAQGVDNPATGIFEDLAEFESRLDALDAAETGRVAIVEADIEALEGIVGNENSGLVKEVNTLKTGLSNANTIISQKANANDVYTKDETDNAIAVAVADAEHLKRKTFNTVAEAEAFIAQNALTAEQYIYMIPVESGVNGDKYDEYMYIDGALERVGDWEVDLSDYAKAEDLQNLQTKVNGISDELVDVVKQDELTNALINKVEKTELDNYAKLTDIQNFATQEDITNLTTIINNKVEKVEGKDLVSNDEIAKLLTVEANAEENFIKAVQEGQFNVDETGKLTLIAVDQSLVGGLTNANNESDTLANILNEKANKQAIENINTALNNKVDKNGTDRLITEDEAKKLEKLVINDDGSVSISGTINAANVKELYDNVVRIVTGTGTYEFDGVAKELLGVEKGAQVNIIEKITLAGGSPLIATDKTVDIPLAIGANAGLVKSSAEENKVAVGADGTMEVNSLNVNKLVQTEGDVVILNGGNSAGEY